MAYNEVSKWTVDASATAALATATKAAVEYKTHKLHTVVAGWSAATIGTLTIKSGATVLLTIPVHNAVVLSLAAPLEAGVNSALSAELSAGAAGVVGRVGIAGE